jgi:predicted transglutaminase-like cysteine proteinase
VQARRPSKRQKAKLKVNHDLWNQMWKTVCPAICNSPLKPAPIKLRPDRLRAILMGLIVLGAMHGPAASAGDLNNNGDGQIVLAALNNTVPNDRTNSYPDLFGATEQRYSDIRPFTKWTGVLNRFKEDFASSLDRPEVQDWMKFLGTLKDVSNEKKIEAVNDYMNKEKFIPDSKNYGVSDYWATPMEFLAHGGGDCEDYAVAKYISLRALGFGQNEMRLAIVYDKVMRMPHALLIVYSDNEAKVLDSQNPAVMDSAEITRYKPIYSISQVAWWRH